MLNSFYFHEQDRDGKTSTGTIKINILDDDDLGPEFFYPDCPADPCFTAYAAAIEDNFQVINQFFILPF